MSDEKAKSVPKATPEQRAKALEAANRARRRRADLRAEVAAGKLSFAGLLDLAGEEQEVGRMPVRQALISVPGIGCRKVDAVMEEEGIAPNRRLAGLGKRQRAKLIERIDGPNAE